MNRVGVAIFGLCVLLAASTMVMAADAEVPEPFRGFDPDSEYTINYDDLSNLLRSVVIDVGRSTRRVGLTGPEITGTRMKTKVRKTANEGNRFAYETFQESEPGREFLIHIRDSLAALPTETPLEKFSRDEQLAYWINLYNVTVLNEVIAVYPKKNLKRYFGGRKSFFKKKILTVSGVPLSLDDIQYTILKQNYDGNPLVLYGLYQGIVGSPNIRTSAYTGEDVYIALEKNADNFINANRGTYVLDEKTFRISNLYDRNKAYFPDFETDVTAHLLQFLDGKERVALENSSKLKANIADWTITDFAGKRHNVGGSLAHNSAALLDAYRSDTATVSGGVMTASIEVTQVGEDEPEKEVRIEDLQRFPVKGARVEKITPDEAESGN